MVKQIYLSVLLTLLLVTPAFADNYKNFAKGQVAQGYNEASTAINLATGHGARFPSPPFKAVWWNCTDFQTATDDLDREVVLVNSASTDTWTSIIRGYDGTTAVAHNDSGKSYCVSQDWIADDIAKVYAAIATGAGGPQDMLNIVAADLQANLAAAVTAAGTTKALRITNTQTATVNTNFSAIPAIWIPCPGKLSWTDGLFMDFDRPEQIVAGDCQIFDAKAGVRFAKPGKVNPRWWGGGPDKSAGANKTALDQAIASLPAAAANTTAEIAIVGGVYQVDNTISSNSKNVLIKCYGDSGVMLTTSATNRHLFQATGTTSWWGAEDCHLKTSSTIVTDLTMKAFAMDVGNGVSSAPAGSVFYFRRNKVEGFNIGSNCDGGDSFVIDVCIDEYNVYKTGGSGGAAVNEGSHHLRCVHCWLSHNRYNGDTKGEHAVYVIHPLHLDLNDITATGYQFEAVKVLTFSTAAGLTNPRHWKLSFVTLTNNVGSMVLETNQSYVLPQVSVDHLAIDGDSAVGSNEAAVLVQALGTSHLRHVAFNGFQLSNATKSGIILNTSTTGTISRADLHSLQFYNWSTASAALYPAVYSSNANGTKRSISVSGDFDCGANGRNIFGTDFDLYWADVQALDVRTNSCPIPDSSRPHVRVGGSSSVAQIGGTHYQKSTTTATDANTTEKTLDTVTIKANSLTSNKNGFHIVMFGTFASNANTKTLRIKVGSTTVITNDKTPAPNGVTWTADLWIVWTGTDAQVVRATMQVDCVNQTPTVTATALDDASDFTVTATGQNDTASANDIRHNVTFSEYKS